MGSSDNRPRWVLALIALVSGWGLLTAALSIYEYVRFGVQWGFLTGERDLDPVFFSMSLHMIQPYGALSMLTGNAVIAALFVPLIFGFGFFRGMVGRASLIAVFVFSVMFAGDIMASGYAFHFGATWAEGEAFRELFFAPGLIIAVFGPGLILFGWAIWRR